MDADPRFCGRVQAARGSAAEKVESAVFKAATTTDKHGRHDVKAQELWLTNQAPEDWKRRHEDTRSSDTDREVFARAKEMSAEQKAAARDAAHEDISSETSTPNSDTLH